MIFLENYVDKRVKHLPFLESPVVPMIFVAAYFSILYFGKIFMKTRKPFELKRSIAAYNILQVVLCMVNLKLFYAGGFTFRMLYKCNAIDFSTSQRAMSMVYACYFTFLLKGFDLLETFFFILRKKDCQLTFLHVYHHASTFIISWFYCRSIPGSNMAFPIVLNLSVHIFMYSYYFMSVAFGQEVQKRLLWFKKSITTIQLIQFVFFFANGIFMAVHKNCETSTITIIVYIYSALLYLYLFGKFYVTRYLKNSSRNFNGKQMKICS